MEQFCVTGMTCAACQAHVEKAVAKVPGVQNVSVSLLTNSMTVEGSAGTQEIIRAVEKAGYGASSTSPAAEEKNGTQSRLKRQEEALRDRETPKLLKRLGFSVGFLLILMYITMGHHMLSWPLPSFLEENYIALALTQMLLAIIVMFINRAFFVSGFQSLMHGAPNMDTLVALGSGVSFGWSLFVFYRMTVLLTGGAQYASLADLYHNRLYFESAAMIPALITVGKTLEAFSKGKTTDALKDLMKMAPKTAVLLVDGEEVRVDIDEVKVSDIFVVKPGEAVPVDGEILSGETSVDESALTGESVPADKGPGDRIHAATINKQGFIRAKALKVGEDTTYARIIRMVSDASATKAPIARIADKVAGVFVPAVILIALIVCAGHLIAGSEFSEALERAICVLVISCPCALGLATPVAIMVGSGLGARGGILFKTGEALETAGRVRIAVLDKTGTITEGCPQVTDIIPEDGTSEEELLSYAYALELKSEHPLSAAIVSRGDELGLKKQEVTGFQALPGNGLVAEICGTHLAGGSMNFIEGRAAISENFSHHALRLSEEGKTPLFFEKDGRVLGIIAVADVIKESSAAAVRELQHMGIDVVMLTGDNRRTAEAIARSAGVDYVIAGVLPDGKEAVIRRLQKYGRVAMVGDGINDAPALMTADVGIAIGAGTDIAIDSADIVLMNSTLTDVSAAIRLSRRTLVHIRQNLFWAFAYNLILIPMAAGLYPGIEMNPMWGAAAMSLSSFTVCMNALRLNLFDMHSSRNDRGRGGVLPAELFDNGPDEPETTDSVKENEKMTKTVKIEGMMCEHCEARVKKTLEKIEGVESAEVSHVKGEAVLTLTADVDEETIRKAVEDQDYTFVSLS